ncbi:MAG: putative sugar O-methyltransferase, partial [Sedimentisphaerales bacterium]|nr:putative sugar O-methyltransferase [Sedimentisphaerales bacterium]
MSTLNYGSVWQKAVANMAAVLDSGLHANEGLRRILELGYFTQLTSYPSPKFNDTVAAWLQQYLVDRYDVEIDNLPNDLVELDIVPVATIVRRGKRKLSPDLLRYAVYAMQLRTVWPFHGERRLDILEIGSGYGGFARTLKCFHPGARFWLTDIPESLRCAEIFLRAAFPDATIAWQKVGDGETA